MRLRLEAGTWQIGEALAADPGGFGAVRRASGASCADAVAKFVPKAPGADRELLIGRDLRGLSDEVVIPVIDVGETADSFVLVMPRAEMSLQQRLAEPMGLEECVAVLAQVATALTQVAPHVVHRDLKPANVLLWKGRWRLADFGIARYADAATETETRKYSLTVPYAAPEQWLSQHATTATDVYAFGVMAYQLVAGHLPFDGPEVADFRDQHLGHAPPTLTAGTQRLRSIIAECLAKAPEARPTPANLVSRLEKASVEPVRTGAKRLAAINSLEGELRLQAETAAESARSEGTRRAQLFDSGAAMFASFAQPLLEAIEDEAPLAQIERGAGHGKMHFVARFGSVGLGLSQPEPVEGWQGPFDVIGAATISVNMPGNGFGWEGRAHSLWYCDARTPGEYHWYELAFMDSPLLPSTKPVEPYSLNPSQASAAFSGVVGMTQLAWPVALIDRDDPADFADRWIDWFAEAAQGTLARPGMMPERGTSGSWRRIP